MNKEDEATRKYEEAMGYEYSEPERALSILRQAVSDYPQTLTVNNHVLDSIITIAISIKNWDYAIDACKIAEKLKPAYKESYKLEREACKLEKEGKIIEATEIRLKKDSLHGEWYKSLRVYGDKFAELGAHDRAWGLYNQAVRVAVSEGDSPHTIRVSMAKLLIKENKPKQAGHMIITGIDESNRYSKKGVPKSLVNFLNKIMKSMGIKDRKKAEDVAHLSKTKGFKIAIQQFDNIVKPD